MKAVGAPIWDPQLREVYAPFILELQVVGVCGR
jgi:hypothetical protein